MTGAGARVRAGARAGVATLVAALLVGCAVEEPVTRPEVISVESPFRYPVALWDSEAQGEAVVMVHVTEAGVVDSVYVARSSGEAGFDSAAVAGAYELRFAPARRGERRIAMWARLPVRFRHPARGAGGVE